jgi:predicted Zn-dependent peptidase
MDDRFVIDRLPNGLVVAMEVMPDARSTACGFLVRAGSRDDPAPWAGMSHFLEHMCFKGNERRTSQELNIGFDDIGADNNAQTSKDQTFYYSWARTEDLERQLELLSEVMRPSLPQDEFEIEKEVILEEIASYKDDLTAVAYDFLYEQICSGHPISRPVLGYENTIRPMTRDDMLAYFRRKYSPENIILVVAGNMKPNAVLSLARKHCGEWDGEHPAREEQRPPEVISGWGSRVTDRFHQQAVAIAFPSVSTTHRLDETAEAVSAILGGANSRFFWNIYQKGLATRVSVIREEYEDFGVLIFVGLCEPENTGRLLEAMRREAESLTRTGPEPKEIQRVKNHRRTFLATESEAPGYRLGQIADDVHYRGAPRPTEVRLAEVDAVSLDTVAAYLKDFPIIGPGFVATVGPREWTPGN